LEVGPKYKEGDILFDFKWNIILLIDGCYPHFYRIYEVKTEHGVFSADILEFDSIREREKVGEL